MNTFKAGGVETSSCNPVVVVAATCTNATVNVIQQSVGGIAELPQVAPPLASNEHLAAGSWITMLAAVAMGSATLLAAAFYAWRRRKSIP